MSTPVTLPLMPATATVETPAPVLPPDDVFTSLLMALTQAIGMPMPQRGPATHLPDAPSAAAAPVSGSPVAASPVAALPPAGAVEAVPEPAVGAWAVATQRAVLPEVALAHPAPAEWAGTPDRVEGAPGKAAVAPGQVDGPPTVRHGAAVRDLTPAAEHAPRPEGLGHAVPEAAQRPEAPEVEAVVPPAPVAAVAPDGPAAPVTGDAGVEGVSSTRHVTPAVVEAAHGLRHEGGGRTSLVVRLDPPELGAVLVRLTVQDGRVDVQLRTPDLVARADLQAQSYDVQQVLREQGFDLASFDVQHGDVLTGGRDREAPERGTPEQPRRADGRTTHADVTDDDPAPTPSGTWL